MNKTILCKDDIYLLHDDIYHASFSEQANDLHWERLIQSSLDNKTGSSFLSSSEIKELLKQAIKNKVESDPNSERIFYRMLKNMQSQKLCRRKDIDQLMEDYHRLKRLFLSGSSKSLPPEATQLWNSGPSDDCDEQKIEPIEHIDFAECNMKVETDFCRICQAQLLDQSKDLFFDAHNAQTYADIIQETLNVKVIYNCKEGLCYFSSNIVFLNADSTNGVSPNDLFSRHIALPFGVLMSRFQQIEAFESS